MRFFFRYLKGHWKICLGYLLGCGIFWLICCVYRIPAEASGYTAFLVSFVMLLLGGTDCLHSWQRWRILEQLKEREFLTEEMLPEPRSELEEGYQELLGELIRRKQREGAAQQGRLSEMTDYYTMWVHQIKTPIAAMHLLLEQESPQQESPKQGSPHLSGGQEGPVEIPQRSREELLEEELFQIERYVEMVLVYLRSQQMGEDLSLAYHQLDDLVRQAVRKYARLFIRKRISLDFQPTGMRVLTDEKWLVFVLEQLLSNALKYTPAGGRVTIRREDPGSMVLALEDTGIGIAPEDLPRIFERGYTGYNGRMDKKSTGIGLYLCRRITGRLSHKLTVRSQVGQGTRVFLDFTLYGGSNE